MIDNYLLEELVTFAHVGTLAETAKRLNVTQPTVTRGMQNLEALSEVQLFNRQPNRISLTNTGKQAAKEAEHILDANRQFVTKIRNYDYSHRVLTVGSTLPGPLTLFTSLEHELTTTIHTDSILLTQDEVTSTLITQSRSLVFSNYKIQSDTLSSKFIGTERLSVCLNRFMQQANQVSITFKELQGLSFVVFADIGPWRQIIQTDIPSAKFLYQDQQTSVTEITRHSNLPFFISNISAYATTMNDAKFTDNNRVCLPISDQQARMPIYANFLTQQSQSIQPLISIMRNNWPD